MTTSSAEAIDLYWESRGYMPPVMTRKSALKKRSVTIAGHGTSVSLETAFWDGLKKIAEQRGQSVNALISDIDRERTGNLSSAIRVYVLEHLHIYQ